jgi:hypothetical protein
MPCPSHPPWLDRSNYTWRRVQVMKFLIMQFSPIAYDLIPFHSTYFLQHYHFFPLALQPNSSLDRLHKTFRFISVSRSRTVGRTPWTGDQLVARPLPVHKHRKTHTQHIH